VAVAPIRLPRDVQWTLAERMAAEREAFGFYFSAHPVDHHKHLLAAHRVRTSSELGSIPIPTDGGRTAATMAGLVEEARWRTSQKGRRFLMARLSDSAGQFDATVFDDEASTAIEAAAKAGACGLLSVELDRRPGEDQPRVTIRRFQPLDELAKRSRLELTIRCEDVACIEAVAAELRKAAGGTGFVRLGTRLADGREAVLLLGKNYALDAELVARLERHTGAGSIALDAAEPMRLVG
jgi:DNA polymerase-3 subunit alpha